MNIVQVHEKVKINSSPYKIKKSLEFEGIKPKIITFDSKVNDADVIVLKKNLIYKIKNRLLHSKNKWEYKKNYKFLPGFSYSYGDVGTDISKLKVVKEADIVMFHWICGGFISPTDIKKVCLLNKKIIWVCHDSWPFTGGCHVRMGCEKFTTGCGCCPMLSSKINKDWSYKLLRRKIKSIDDKLLTVVSPSNWMDSNVGKSLLFKNCNHLVIPNPIDTNKYNKREKKQLRNKYAIDINKKVILFGAVNATTTPYKGFSYLIDALKILSDSVDCKEYEIVIFGSDKSDIDNDKLKFKISYLGRLNEEQMIDAYNLSDVFVTSTLDDNLPNTVMESLSCEVPVVAFDTGGVSDMLKDRENGYLAKYADSKDLAEGIKWVFDNNKNNILGIKGREYICENFDEKVIAKKYKALFFNIAGIGV